MTTRDYQRKSTLSIFLHFFKLGKKLNVNLEALWYHTDNIKENETRRCLKCCTLWFASWLWAVPWP